MQVDPEVTSTSTVWLNRFDRKVMQRDRWARGREREAWYAISCLSLVKRLQPTLSIWTVRPSKKATQGNILTWHPSIRQYGKEGLRHAGSNQLRNALLRKWLTQPWAKLRAFEFLQVPVCSHRLVARLLSDELINVSWHSLSLHPQIVRQEYKMHSYRCAVLRIK